MKILIVSNMYPSKKYPYYGVFVKRFCQNLKNIDIEYDLAIMHKASNKIIKIFFYIHFYFSTFLKVIIKNYDCIYIHYASHSSKPVLLASKFKKIKIYTNVHGSDVVPENLKHEKMQKNTINILKISNKIIVPSEYFKEYVHKKYSINKNMIYIFPSGGIDSKVFYSYTKEGKRAAKNSFDLSNSKISIGFIGRISEGKGWSTYLYAIKEILEINPNIEFLLVGSGVESSKANKLIDELDIKQYVKQLPLQKPEKLAKIYNALDAFIFPTEREGESLGLVGLESMACGTPVISSDFAAPKYYIQDFYNGFKFEKGNHKDLVRKIQKFIELPEFEKEKMSINCIKTSEKYLSENILDLLRNIFERNEEVGLF